MTRKRAHSLLSELHGLLANYGTEEFFEAARFSPGLSQALELLGHQAEENNNSTRVSSNGEISSSDAPRSVSLLNGSSLHGAAEASNEVSALLSRSPHGQSSTAVLDFALSHGIEIPANPKDGKMRLIRRLSAAIAALPKKERSAILSELKKKTGSQTQGWVDVLKGR